eukprot:944277-Pyramimonas_sp.AAC.1
MVVCAECLHGVVPRALHLGRDQIDMHLRGRRQTEEIPRLTKQRRPVPNAHLPSTVALIRSNRGALQPVELRPRLQPHHPAGQRPFAQGIP